MCKLIFRLAFVFVVSFAITGCGKSKTLTADDSTQWQKIIDDCPDKYLIAFYAAMNAKPQLSGQDYSQFVGMSVEGIIVEILDEMQKHDIDIMPLMIEIQNKNLTSEDLRKEIFFAYVRGATGLLY